MVVVPEVEYWGVGTSRTGEVQCAALDVAQVGSSEWCSGSGGGGSSSSSRHSDGGIKRRGGEGRDWTSRGRRGRRARTGGGEDVWACGRVGGWRWDAEVVGDQGLQRLCFHSSGGWDPLFAVAVAGPLRIDFCRKQRRVETKSRATGRDVEERAWKAWAAWAGGARKDGLVRRRASEASAHRQTSRAAWLRRRLANGAAALASSHALVFRALTAPLCWPPWGPTGRHNRR